VGQGAIGAPEPSGGALEPAALRDGGERIIEQHGQEVAGRAAPLRRFAQHLRNDQTKPRVEYAAQRRIDPAMLVVRRA
jgi:hypothetical protein